MKLPLLTRYGRLGASSRLRALDLQPLLAEAGIECQAAPLLGDDYLRALYEKRRYGLGRVAARYWERAKAIQGLPSGRLLFLQVEALPFLPYWLEQRLLSGHPYLLDCDDAWFHRYDLHGNPLVRLFLGRKIDRLMAAAACVLAGNEYVAERARKAGARRVELLPTGLDCARYDGLPPPERTPATVGWIGAPQNAAYLLPLVGVLARLRQKIGLRLRVVTAERPDLAGLDFDFEPWREEREADSIGGFDIGVMPLPDKPWERGKSGFKLIQYMAAGRPSVASPVGENLRILADARHGLLARTPEEWSSALALLAGSPESRLTMGDAARKEARAKYDRKLIAERLSEIVKSLA